MSILLERAPETVTNTEVDQQLYSIASSIGELAVLSADDVPELEEARTLHAITAMDVLSKRQNAEICDVPAIDAIGTSRRYVEAANNYGKQLSEALELLRVVEEDARTTLGEALYAWGFVSTTVKEYRPETGHFYVGDSSLIDMYRSGISGLLPAWEQERRLPEYVEEGTNEAMVATGLFKDKAILTISLHPGTSDAKRFGYRDENRKMMVRYARFDEVNGQILRTDYQASCDGAELEEISLLLGQEFESETDVLRFQGLLDKQDFPDVIPVLQRLDQIRGNGSFLLRESVEPSTQDYEQLIMESQEKEKEFEDMRAELVEFLIQTAEQNVDPATARKLVFGKVENLIHAAAQQNPEIARNAFDDATAERYAQGLKLKQQGQIGAAKDLWNLARELAPEVAFCGSSGDQDVADKVGGMPRPSDPTEEGLFGDTVYENASCIGCPAFNTKVGANGYCGDCAKACTDPQEDMQQAADRMTEVDEQTFDLFAMFELFSSKRV